jgi:hypothetical protein
VYSSSIDVCSATVRALIASGVGQPAVNRYQPGSMSVDAKFVDAPFQLDQLTGARSRFPQHLMEIMGDLPDPLCNCRGIKAA